MIDQDMMRIRNLSQVLECIRTSGGPCTKRGIQAGTGLSWASASGLTEELIQQGYVIETTRRSENSLGRPAKAYDINPRRNLYIGVDINVESLHLAVIDLKCRLLYTESKMLVEYERDSIVGMVKEMIRRALDSGPVNAGEVKGVGFALMSVVDIENGVAVYSQHFKDWKNVSIRRIFEDEFRLPVLVEHDPTCLAIAEMNLGHGKFNSKVVYLRVSLGIGVSIVL
ncbi:MAG: ROK family protein, partial [Firmicutes bacterium]|nr:ROK family protein [Bacillota bacterium]